MVEKITKKNKNLRNTIFLILLFFIGFFAIYKYNQSHKAKIATQIVNDLENYRRINKYYPISLTTIYKENIDWLYYASDSVKNTFYLSYSKGIMRVNTVIYNSENKEWQIKFNY